MTSQASNVADTHRMFVTISLELLAVTESERHGNRVVHFIMVSCLT